MSERPRQAGAEHAALIAGAFARGLERPGAPTEALSCALIADGPLLLPDDFWFPREIYGRQAVVSGVNNCLRVVLARGDLVLRRGSAVSSWAHGETVKVAADCTILGAISARADLLLTPPCRFARASGRHVRFGAGAHEAADCPALRPPLLRGPLGDAGPGLRRPLEGGLRLAEGEVVPGDLVVRGDVILERRARITGSLQAHGSVILGAGSAVDGALSCRDALAVGARCALGGPISSERLIDLGPGAVVGRDEQPTTVTAPFVRVWGGVVVHGTVKALLEGEALPAKPT